MADRRKSILDLVRPRRKLTGPLPQPAQESPCGTRMCCSLSNQHSVEYLDRNLRPLLSTDVTSRFHSFTPKRVGQREDGAVRGRLNCGIGLALRREWQEYQPLRDLLSTRELRAY